MSQIDDDIEELMCSFCATEENVDTVLDPFLLDIYGDEVMINLCPQCYQNRADDI